MNSGNATCEETAAATLRPKARRVLEAALELFLERGYDQVSTEMIAQAAGVSKATVYAYFPSKEELFSEVVLGRCSELTMRIAIPDEIPADFERSLVEIGCSLLEVFADELGVRLYRLLVGEVHRFPKLALSFEAAGPSDIESRMADYFRRATQAGTIATADIAMATDLYLSLVMGSLPFDLALGLPSWDDARNRARIEAAVALFLRGVAALGPTTNGGR